MVIIKNSLYKILYVPGLIYENFPYDVPIISGIKEGISSLILVGYNIGILCPQIRNCDIYRNSQAILIRQNELNINDYFEKITKYFFDYGSKIENIYSIHLS
ncbi:hypothetical protein H8356DRAFT_1068673 [Neocallimastix lanati (nom. inval.)]|uniref:Uncharacterized protein n=1 Tax=Neocallimastix californiae TaxID=1754190 RepID=A0A1Y1YDK9_9FUNG|nr:hypothetical protein H8356DRAFT_1068673 [Neocallimastix sp. JGI-2020a]ORX96082.1 hypothetical protein LY90DRAFT_520238 [Neocallimastix californiae]|eukprot:ORX96082.1 hypothetical protein LY90DRAFT_520238 [Neocallimastix californiae]